jgi:steroid delta-isomerase-like uncharacterized protein
LFPKLEDTMTHDEVVALITRNIEAWDRRDIDAWASMFTEDAVWDDPAMPRPVEGRDALCEFAKGVFRAFPDFKLVPRAPICVSADGTLCAVPWRVHATHLGPLDPPGWAPTNRSADFEGVDLLELVDGKIRRINSYFDIRSAASQFMGVDLTPPAGGFREQSLVMVQKLFAAVSRMRAPEPVGTK